MAAYGEQESMNRNFGAYGAEVYEKDCEGDYAVAGSQAAPEKSYDRQGTSSKLNGHGNTYKAGSSNKWVVIAGIIAVLAIAVIIAAAIVLCCCLKSSSDDDCAQQAINDINAGNPPSDDVNQCFQDLASNNEQEFAAQTKEFLDSQKEIINKWNDAGTKKASESGLSVPEQTQLTDTLDFIVTLLEMGTQAIGDDASKSNEKEQFERLNITFQILSLLAGGQITEAELKEYHDELQANEAAETKCNAFKDESTCGKEDTCEWDKDADKMATEAFSDKTGPICVAKASAKKTLDPATKGVLGGDASTYSPTTDTAATSPKPMTLLSKKVAKD